MSDFIFVVKCFAYTLLISFFMQIKVSNVSLEARVQHFLKSSAAVEYLQQASAGGARALHEGYGYARNLIINTTKSIRFSSESPYLKRHDSQDAER